MTRLPRVAKRCGQGGDWIFFSTGIGKGHPRQRRASLDFPSLRSVLVIMERFLMAGMIVIMRAVIVPMLVLVPVLVSGMFVGVAVFVLVGVSMFVGVCFITVFVLMGVGVGMLMIV